MKYDRKTVIRYGSKDILRTPLKSILFLLLLMIITIFLSIGIGMWSVAEGMLSDANEIFMTAGEYVYTGKYDPSATQNNDALIAAKEVLDTLDVEQEAVLLVEENKHQKAMISGFRPAVWDMNYGDCMFLSIKVQSYLTDKDMWMAKITRSVYSEQYEEDLLICLKDEGLSKKLEKGKEYVVYGKAIIYSGLPFDGIEPAALKEGEEPFCVELSEKFTYNDFLETEDGVSYLKKLEQIEALNLALDIITTKQVEAVTAFHIGEYTLTEGSYFGKEDYKKGTSCIIPKYIAEKMEVQVGDSIELSILKGVTGKGVNNCYENEDSITYTGEFTIAGIYEAENRGTPVYIADAGQEWISLSDNEPVFKRVVIDNRKAEDYLTRMQGMLPEGVKLELSDQGYQASVSSINGMLRTARMLTIAFGLVAVLVIAVFLYIRLNSAQKSMKTLVALGSGVQNTWLYFMTGNSLMILVSGILGCGIGFVASYFMIGKVFAGIEKNSVFDYRFSVNGYGMMSGRFKAEPNITMTAFFILALVLILFVIAASGILFYCAIKSMDGKNRRMTTGKVKSREENARKKEDIETTERTAQNQKLGRTKRHNFDVIPFLSLRYAVRNIVRSGVLSLVVPVLFLVLLTFLNVFSNMKNNFAKELSGVYENVPVTLQFTDITGRKTDGLVIDVTQLEELTATGFVENSWKCSTYYAKSLGNVTFDEETGNIEYEQSFEVPQGSYAFETMKAQWKGLSTPLIVAEDIYKSPQLMYERDFEITWAEDYSYEKFLANEPCVGQWFYGCIVPSYYLEEEGYEIGDLIAFVFPFDTEYSMATEVVKIVGVYESQNTADAIFMMPETVDRSCTGLQMLAYYPDFTSIVGDSATSAGALLCNTSHLSKLKDYLEAHYDMTGTAGKYRKWIMIDDRALYETIDNLTRYIQYMKLLYPFVMVLIIVIGFLVSNILLRIRNREIAMLRSMGCKKGIIYRSLLWEYLILSLAGCMAGALISVFLMGNGEGMFLQMALLLGCYFGGTIIAMVKNVKRALMRTLKSEEE